MLKLAMTSVLAIAMAAAPAHAMCCGDKDKAKADSKMQCMKMGADMGKSGQDGAGDKTKADDPHAGMDMGKDGSMDHSKMSGCGCCGEKKSG